VDKCKPLPAGCGMITDMLALACPGLVNALARARSLPEAGGLALGHVTCQILLAISYSWQFSRQGTSGLLLYFFATDLGEGCQLEAY